MPPSVEVVNFIDPYKRRGVKRSRPDDSSGGNVYQGALPSADRSRSGGALRGGFGGAPRGRFGGGAPRGHFRGGARRGGGVEDERTIRASVAALGASGFDVAKRKRWEGGILAAAGAVVHSPVTQRMPQKMRRGVMKARREKAAKADAEALASGVVRPAGAKKRKVRRAWAQPAEDEPVPHSLRGPVMHVGSR